MKLGVNYLENYMHLHKTFVTHEIEKLVCGQNTNYHAFNINTEFLSNYKKFALNETFKDIKVLL